MDVVDQIGQIVAKTLQTCVDQGAIELADIPTDPPVEKPKNPEHGDYATSICLQLAKPARKNPREIAQAFLVHLTDPDGIIERCEVAGPGFINFTVRADVWREMARSIALQGKDFGRNTMGAGKRVLVEFVSANPTGPLHVGHGRGAVTGDTVASLLEACGYEVEREYYINDVGNQMNILGRSLLVRYQQQCGRDVPFPENHYQGDYVSEIATAFREEHGDKWVDHDYESDAEPFLAFIKDRVLDSLKQTLEALGIRFDRWFSERSLHDAGRVEGVVKTLTDRNAVRTDDDGRVWFNSSEFGDDEDRVVVRDTGVPTYFAADIAYHDEKIERGYDLCINVWGADHHGYIARVKASLQALGYDPDRLEILLYQFVSLVENGAPVRMSTRGGVFETLDDLMAEVGRDATRFNFLMRKSDAQFEFDLGLAKSQSLDNPVYYVQYGHARICQVLAKAKEAGYTVPDAASADLSPLVLPEEIDLIRASLDYPWTLRAASMARAPHHLVNYLQDLIGKFHSYYTRYKHSEKVVSSDKAKTLARIFLCNCLRITLANSLALLGVTAPEKMYFSE